MIKVEVEILERMIVELPINSYEEIFFENMKRSESDELISDAIYKKYNIIANNIRVVKEVK